MDSVTIRLDRQLTREYRIEHRGAAVGVSSINLLEADKLSPSWSKCSPQLLTAWINQTQPSYFLPFQNVYVITNDS